MKSRGHIFSLLALTALTSLACATLRTPQGKQVPLFHQTYHSDKNDDVRRDLNQKTILDGKKVDNKMPDYEVFEGPEDYINWGSQYTR